MKKMFFTYLIFSLGTVVLAQTSQTKATPEQRAQRITNWMSKKLTLTDDQKTKIYDVNLKYAKLNQQTKTNDASDKKAMHQELKANEQEREAEFKTILSAEQFQAFQTAKQELEERRLQRKRRG